MKFEVYLKNHTSRLDDEVIVIEAENMDDAEQKANEQCYPGMSVLWIREKEELVEVKSPIGKFILDNAKGVQLPDGQYFHYSEVCKLLKKYKKSLK